MRKQQPETDEAASRVEFDSAELERDEDQTLRTSSLNAFDDGSESSTATLCSTKAFTEQLAFVEVLGHNVVMLRSDHELVLVQLLKTAQNRRPVETSVRYGPRMSHQSQSKINNPNQVSTTLENLLREKLSNDSISLAWPTRYATWSLTKFHANNDGRTALLQVSGKAYTSQLPFGERVMYEHTAVPTDSLNQRWDHGIWIGEAPMTDECIVLTESGVQKAKSLHRVTPKEKFLISELEKAREFPWNNVAENLKSAIETRQDQDSSGHRRMCLTIEIVMRIGATPGCSGCAGSRSHTGACQVRSRRTLADAKESESSRTVGAGVGSIAKMTVEPQQPTAVMQQEPSPSPSSGPTAPMQEPTQNIQNEQMDSPMELGGQEHREQRRVRLNETVSSEMSKKRVVKAKSVHPSMIAPVMDRLGSTVLLDPAPSSKDETTTGSLAALNLTHLHHSESCGLCASIAALNVSRSVSKFCASNCRTGHSHSSKA